MFCVSGIGAHIQGMIDGARKAKRVVTIDGCKTCCSKKIAEHTALNVTDPIVVTDTGIEKAHNFNFKPEDVDRVVEHVKQSLRRNPVPEG